MAIFSLSLDLEETLALTLAYKKHQEGLDFPPYVPPTGAKLIEMRHQLRCDDAVSRIIQAQKAHHEREQRRAARKLGKATSASMFLTQLVRKQLEAEGFLEPRPVEAPITGRTSFVPKMKP